MSSYLGLDPQAVRSLASQLTNAAGEIKNVTGQLTNALQNTPWTGPDREQFVNDWQSNHVSQLTNVANALEAAAQHATANAQQQENASNS
jgi:uncharacterized protein YukE